MHLCPQTLHTVYYTVLRRFSLNSAYLIQHASLFQLVPFCFIPAVCFRKHFVLRLDLFTEVLLLTILISFFIIRNSSLIATGCILSFAAVILNTYIVFSDRLLSFLRKGYNMRKLKTALRQRPKRAYFISTAYKSCYKIIFMQGVNALNGLTSFLR